MILHEFSLKIGNGCWEGPAWNRTNRLFFLIQKQPTKKATEQLSNVFMLQLQIT